jgi:hypothetical protein
MSFKTDLLAMRPRFADCNVVAILSGGNIDTTVVAPASIRRWDSRPRLPRFPAGGWMTKLYLHIGCCRS